MKGFLDNKEKRCFLVKKLWEIASSDNDLDEQELQLIQGISSGFSTNLQNAIDSDFKPGLTPAESAFCLREMYRITIVNGELKSSELDVIKDFCSYYKVSERLNEITRKWANQMLKAEQEYETEYMKLE